MTTGIENQTTELHPKINKFVVYLGGFVLVSSLAFMLMDKDFLIHLGYFFLSISWILLGLKLQLLERFKSKKTINGLINVLMLVGTIILGYGLFF